MSICVYHMYDVFFVLTAELLLVGVINKLIYLEGAFLQKSSMFGFIQMGTSCASHGWRKSHGFKPPWG